MSNDMWPEDQQKAAYAKKASMADLDDKLREILAADPIKYLGDNSWYSRLISITLFTILSTPNQAGSSGHLCRVQ